MKKHQRRKKAAKTAPEPKQLITPRATLAAIGVKLRALGFFETLGEHLQIRQKTVKHTPVEKLTDAFIALLAGAHGLCESNTRVRSDKALQRAFGRPSCAEQSVVQETLDACTRENVSQMRAAFNELLQTHSRTFAHDYEAGLQLLDVDMSGLPCGATAEAAKKGYFAKQRHVQGRQPGRVTAALYHEVVTDVLCPGNVQLHETLPQLIEQTEKALQLDEARRRRTVLRRDAGGGQSARG